MGYSVISYIEILLKLENRIKSRYEIKPEINKANINYKWLGLKCSFEMRGNREVDYKLIDEIKDNFKEQNGIFL